MISEHKFVTSFTSAWREVMPLGDNYWRKQNLLLHPKLPVVANVAPPDIRGLVNELAFMSFCEILESTPGPQSLSPGSTVMNKRVSAAVANCVPKAVSYISRLPFANEVSLADVGPDCTSEAQYLVRNLFKFFPPSGTYVLRPKFNGCGLLSACEGDLISDGCLYEIKAGDRAFRISDIRQLLVYAALAYAKDALIFDRIGLCNPRKGLIWVKSLDSVCQAVSGQRASDVLANLALHFDSIDTTQ
ncbi:MAG: hypothetical protein ABIP34_20410 [Rhodoferax sp.]|uniref:hypothetical protein n=1 Tax=Rhodoferax sp. TaxID=50421 RepID=UPI003264E91F